MRFSCCGGITVANMLPDNGTYYLVWCIRLRRTKVRNTVNVDLLLCLSKDDGDAVLEAASRPLVFGT